MIVWKWAGIQNNLKLKLNSIQPSFIIFISYTCAFLSTLLAQLQDVAIITGKKGLHTSIICHTFIILLPFINHSWLLLPTGLRGAAANHSWHWATSRCIGTDIGNFFPHIGMADFHCDSTFSTYESPVCLWTVGGSRRTWRKPTQGESVNSTQNGQNQLACLRFFSFLLSKRQW